MTRALGWLGALLVVVAAGASAGPGEVLIVRSSDLPAYRQFEDLFTASLGSPVRSVSAKDADAARAAVTAGGPMLAIGQDAARLIVDAKGQVSSVYALVPNPDKLGAGEAARAVPMFVSAMQQVALVRDFLPNAKRLGVLFDPAASAALVAELERAAKGAGAAIVKQEVKDRTQVANGLRELIGKVDAILLLPDPATLGVDTFKFLLQTALDSKVPLIGFSQGQAKAGALFAFEADYAGQAKEAAAALKRALANTPAAPQATTGVIYFNAKTAQLVGVTLSGAQRAKIKEAF